MPFGIQAMKKIVDSAVDSELEKEERDIDFLKSGINIQFYREVKGEEDAQS